MDGSLHKIQPKIVINVLSIVISIICHCLVLLLFFLIIIIKQYITNSGWTPHDYIIEVKFRILYKSIISLYKIKLREIVVFQYLTNTIVPANTNNCIRETRPWVQRTVLSPHCAPHAPRPSDVESKYSLVESSVHFCARVCVCTVNYM